MHHEAVTIFSPNSEVNDDFYSNHLELADSCSLTQSYRGITLLLSIQYPVLIKDKYIFENVLFIHVLYIRHTL